MCSDTNIVIMIEPTLDVKEIISLKLLDLVLNLSLYGIIS